MNSARHFGKPYHLNGYTKTVLIGLESKLKPMQFTSETI